MFTEETAGPVPAVVIPDEELAGNPGIKALALQFSAITEQTHRVRVYENVMEVQALIPQQTAPPRNYGKKQKITNYTEKSRRYLFKLLGRTQFTKLHRTAFVTLTYHNNYPDKSAEAKRHIHDFLIYLKRMFPDIVYIWRYEFQRRGAPHFHLITGFKNPRKSFSYKEFGRVVYSLWSRFLDCGCQHCRTYSVDARQIKSYRQARAYVAKYMSKNAPSPPTDTTGRFWGRSKDLPARAIKDYYIDSDSFLELRQMCVRLLRSSTKRAREFSEVVNKSWSFFFLLDTVSRETFQLVLMPIEIKEAFNNSP